MACWTLKLSIFLAHAVLFIVIASTTFNTVTNATTNEYLQNAIRLVRANFIVGTLGFIITIFFRACNATRKQNLEKILKAIDEQS